MQIYKGIHEWIGHTPLVELSHFSKGGVRLFAKLESYNPGGSVKDRLGMEFLRDAFASGKITKGSTIIEPTAGNTGIGLALAALKYEVSVIVVVPEKFSLEKQELMKALGATVIHTPSELGMQGAIAKTKELLTLIPNSYSPMQFENDANPNAYYKTLGPEIYAALDGKIDIFIAGAGTGGTFMGCARYLKEQNPRIQTIVVEPVGSILNGGTPGPHETEGIGMEFVPSFVKSEYLDKIYTITDKDAFHCVKEVAKKEGILAGSSSGAALAAALAERDLAKEDQNIVIIFPDSSERYLSQHIYKRGL